MFSVVTIARDRPELFLNHLLSLQNQIMLNQEDWELIILDDSTEGNDKQEEIIKIVCSEGMPCNTRAFRALNRIQFGGEGKIINFGIKKTIGDPIFVICGDDLFPTQHFFLMYRLWNRLIAVGKTKFVLGWPLYHLKQDIKIKPELLTYPDYINSFPEMCQDVLGRREDVCIDFQPGLDVFYGLVDDRSIYPRDFLFNIKGWPEWAGSWWRDAWMWGMMSIHEFVGIVDWTSWALHQSHPLWNVPGNAEAKAHLDKYGGKVKVSNNGPWGEANMREIELRDCSLS